MITRVNYEFEAIKNSEGEFTCGAAAEIPVTHQSNRSFEQQRESTFQQGYQYQPFDAAQADVIFQQSYERNFVSGHNQYVENMRIQFDLMRQSMLDQMESFTFVKNMSK
ncbi:hypothetical protein [Shewanella surugensis]|uniref:Uncharacterized protein n=1 Tax=Shewanella surugensis TaxID=212020 RepID=A0ABT0LFJ3_9GAMM|nr:hypothetical protein [Shewanella surugensis]MCL1126102.1 hypothetical protein [Shewanella surugensis]